MRLFGRRQTVVGLDIGSGFAKLLALNHAGDRPRVSRVAMRPVPSGAVVDGEIVDHAPVSDAVRALVQATGLHGSPVVTAVGGHDVIVKKIEMDRMPERDAREVIQWDVERHVPFDVEGVEVDFQILDPVGDGLRMEVLLVAVKRERVEDRVELLRDAGVDPSIIDVDAFALHNALELNHPEALEGIVSLVDVGYATTTVNILEDGIPVLTRAVPFGSRRLQDELEQTSGLTLEEADKVVRARTTTDELEPFVEASAAEVARGVERAGAFLVARDGGETLGRIFLSGGGARIPGIAEALGRRTEVETVLANPFERVAVDVDAATGVSVEEVAPMLLLALGLALRR